MTTPSDTPPTPGAPPSGAAASHDPDAAPAPLPLGGAGKVPDDTGPLSAADGGKAYAK
ncbi:hypothetical protein [Streptomyces sp. NPDC058657]|uniref:hypothetical protein n=1 Tax=unclassified Streptomyces TaxID=2593676 RepID=UPI00364E9432